MAQILWYTRMLSLFPDAEVTAHACVEHGIRNRKDSEEGALHAPVQ
jgi:hypothetical protein